MKASTLAEPTFVGRKSELKELLRRLDSILKGEGSTVLISGEAGSGKTRLAKEFLKYADKKGINVLSGWCLNNTPIPYFPFIEALGVISEENVESNSQIRTWLTKTNPNEALAIDYASSPHIWKDHTFSAITQELLRISTKKPTILFIDDLHWADSASLSLIHYISRAITSERIMVLATFRSEEINQRTETQNHPLAETIQLMGRDGYYQEISLPKLDKDAIGKIAESMLKGKINSAIVDRLTDQSAGNPLFAVEFLRMQFENGSLKKEGSEWKLLNQKADIPNKIKDVIARRMSNLGPSQKKVLEIASIIGEKFDPETIADIINQPKLDIIEALDSIERSSHLVKCEEEKYYKFNHAKIQDWIYNSIPKIKLKELHFQYAKNLEKTSDTTQFSKIAYHYILSDKTEKARTYSLLAGKDAIDRFSNSEAITHFNYVLNNLPQSDELIAEQEIALTGLGDAYFACNMFNEAKVTFEKLAKMQSGSKKANTLFKAMQPVFFQGDIPHLTELVKQVETIPEITRLDTAKLLHYKGAIFNLQCNFSKGMKFIEDAMEIFEEEYDLTNAAWLMFILADGKSILGNNDRAITLALRSISIFQDLNDLQLQLEALSEVGVTFHNIGLIEEAITWYNKVIDLDKKNKMNNYFMLAKITLFKAQLVEVTDVKKALSGNFEALDFCNKTDSNAFIGRIYVNLTRLYSIIGDISKADEYYSKLMVLPSAVVQTMVSRFLLDISLAVYFAAKGQQELANEHLDRHLKFIKKTSSDSKILLQALPNQVWILTKQGKTQQATELSKEIHKGITTIRKQFEKTDLQSNLMSRRVVRVGEEFEVRVDIINVGNRPGKLIKVENLIPTNFLMSKIHPVLPIANNSIDFSNHTIAAFGDTEIKIRGYAKNPGVISFKPTIDYTDFNGVCKTLFLKPIQITILATTKDNYAQDNRKEIDVPTQFQFNQVAAQKSFEFLVEEFSNDYMKNKIDFQKSGWRSLTQISKKTNLPLSCFYPKRGRFGTAIAELERRGLVEVRMFPGERGRGGKIMRARVDVEKTLLKDFIKNKIAYGSENKK